MRYRIEARREIEITSASLIDRFPDEWRDAQARDLSEDAFARECFKECDFDTLETLGDEVEVDEFDVEVLA